MRRLILMAALSALVIAKPKPETYRETEDFQYARSSTDEGHKSGYYGAQRGNMGGNYERAHNMDFLAQHQMSGLVRQVDGELGEGAKTRTGSVYTAASTRGIYGSGNYDLTNLKGRNFAEGESKGSSQAYSAQTSQNSGYRGHSYSGINSEYNSNSQAHDSRYIGYQTLGHIDQRQIDNLQHVDKSQDFGRYEHDNKAGYNTNYHSQYGSHEQSEFDQSSTNLHRSTGYDANTRSRYITTPVRVVVRPGGRVAIPISAPTYSLTDAQSVLADDKNDINSDAEILNQHTSFVPGNKVKHYESSYSYRKQWEKHHTEPAEVAVVVPTENPFPKNTEFYDDEQLLQSAKDQLQTANLQTVHANNINSEHRANTKSAASAQSVSQSAFNSHHSQSGFNAQQSRASSGSYANAYGHSGQKSGVTTDLTNTVENLDLKPKSYHSSYSYHKSWERQGDPYVIKPSESYDGQSSQRLTAASANSAAYSSHHYGSHSRKAHQSYLADCDDEGHVRVARSYNSDENLQQQQQNRWEDLTQQSQSGLERLEDLGQQTQTKWENLEDLGQQQQNGWDNLQDLGQQAQNQWDNLQQLGQQTQNQFDSLQPLDQETQSHFDNLQQLEQTQDKLDKLEDLGQHTQSGIEQSQNGNLEDLSQQSQKEDTIINFEQQSNSEDTAELNKNYSQQESQLNSNTWDQIAGFEPHENAPNIHDKNNPNGVISSDNFMSPILESKDNNEHDSRPLPVQNVATNVNEKPNLFATSPNNKEFNSPWGQNNNQNIFWSSNLYPNTNENFMNNFWHLNENSNFHSREHNFKSNSNSSSYTGSHIQSLWNKIDNIAGEFSATEVNTQNNKFYPHEYSDSNNQHINHNQNGFDWSDISGFSNFQNTEIHTDKDKGINSEHYNSFGAQTHIESTTKKSKISLFANGKAGPDSNSTAPINKNINSSDEGRGDIGPEDAFFDITATNKPYKTQEEIDILSLKKEASSRRPDDIIVQPSINKNKDETTDSTLTVVNISSGENKNRNRQNEFITNSHFRITSTIPAMQIGIIPKETIPKQNPVFHEQKPQEQIADVETPKDLEQNLEQQFESFDQQLQGSWFSNDHLQQGYDQQNVEQQFEVFNHGNDKQYKTSKEIETLSLTKEPVSVAPNTISSTTPIIQIVTTPKKLTQKPFLNEMELDNPLMYVQKHKPQKEMTENFEIPEDIEQTNLEQQFEDFDQQLQNSWFSSDNLQQAFDQNVEPQFQVFHQSENNKLYKTPEEIETLSLTQERSSIKPNNIMSSPTPIIQVGTLPKVPNSDEPDTPEDIKQQNLEQQSENLQQPPVYVYDQQNTEKQFMVLHQQSNLEAIPSTAETKTEKPGFWTSVGSKFSNAKDKVVSWFKSI